MEDDPKFASVAKPRQKEPVEQPVRTLVNTATIPLLFFFCLGV